MQATLGYLATLQMNRGSSRRGVYILDEQLKKGRELAFDIDVCVSYDNRNLRSPPFPCRPLDGGRQQSCQWPSPAYPG